ncbi:MAG: hypothetical protein GQ582_12865 [Methyloprofundus sp.]|nr:hypothetical protein [Methyloprofundus sp.]
MIQKEKIKIISLVFLLLFIVIGNSGIWVMPNIDYQFIVSQNLLDNPFPDKNSHYIITNYFQPLIFGLLGGSSLAAYIIYAFVTATAFLSVLSYWYINNYKEFSQYSILSIIIFPVFMIPFYWLGMDGMTLLLMALAMINRHSKWGFIFAIFLGLQHFSQGLVGFLILIFTLIISSFNDKKSIYNTAREYIFIVLGGVLGKVILIAWFYIIGIELLGDRLLYIKTHQHDFFSQWLTGWPYILYSLFGMGWVLVIFKIKKTWPLIIAAFIVLILTSFVGDQTRVGVIILFPSLFYWVFLNKELLNSIRFKFILTLLIIHLVVPVIYVWSGWAYNDLWYADKQAIQSEFNLSLSFPYNRHSKFCMGICEYDAIYLPSQIGRAVNKGLIVQEGAGKLGYLTYGPYVKLLAGKYEFDMRYQSTMASTESSGTWDVIINTLDNQKKYLATGSIMGTDSLEGHIVKPFIVPKELSNKMIEIRSLYNGKGNLAVYHLKIYAIN